MNKKQVLDYFANDIVIDHYTKATANVGLWESENIVFTRSFSKEDQILELGSGTGRIALAMEKLGYKNIQATEFSTNMLQEARRIAKITGSLLSFEQADATNLVQYPDNSFDAIIFGFNGLMQIPQRANRKKALTEILRILRPKGRFIFTTHDRDNPRRKNYWENEAMLWKKNQQDKNLDEFGDRYVETELGKLYIHVPSKAEVMSDLKEAGFKVELDKLRSQIAQESMQTKDFSDECRFWVTRKPKAS